MDWYPALALEAIGAGAAASWQLNNLGPKIVAADYRPGFLIKLLRKDLRLVTDAARDTENTATGIVVGEYAFRRCLRPRP